MRRVPPIILRAPLLAIATWRSTQAKERPPEEISERKLAVPPSGKGWWGIKPSYWDWVLLGIFLLFLTPGCLGTVAAAEIIKQKILDYVFLSQGDAIVTGYGFGTMAAFFLGVIVAHGTFDIVSELILWQLKKTTGKARQQLIPAIYGQAEAMGLAGESAIRWRKLVYGKVGAVLLIVALFGAMGGYTRFTDSEVIHCGWPGLTEERYTYDDIFYIWDVEGKSSHYYAVEFVDGFLWSTNLLSPDFLHNRPQTDIAVNGGYMISYLLERTGLPLTEGESY